MRDAIQSGTPATKITMTWTQSICSSCYSRREPGRDPVRVLGDELEICCDCGSQTIDGIYLRLNPAEVKHPRADDE